MSPLACASSRRYADVLRLLLYAGLNGNGDLRLHIILFHAIDSLSLKLHILVTTELILPE